MKRWGLISALVALGLVVLVSMGSLAYFLGRISHPPPVVPPATHDQTKDKKDKTGTLSEHTLEGEVVRKDANSYVVKDKGGREFRLHINQKTNVEEQPEIGDTVRAQVDARPSDVHTKSLEIRAAAREGAKGAKNSAIPDIVEGELVKLDGQEYFVQDISGKQVKLHTDYKTKKDGNLTLGDQVNARVDNAISPGYAVSITKR